MEMKKKGMRRLAVNGGYSLIQMEHPMEANLTYEVASVGCTGEAKDDAEIRALTPVKAKTLRRYFGAAIDKDARVLIGKLHRGENDRVYFRVLSNTQLSQMGPEKIKDLQVLIRESTTGAALDLIEMEKSLERQSQDARFRQLRSNTAHSLRANWTISFRIYDLETAASSPDELVTAYMLARATTVEVYDYGHGYFRKSSHDALVEQRRCKAIESQKELEKQDLCRKLGVGSLRDVKSLMA